MLRAAVEAINAEITQVEQIVARAQARLQRLQQARDLLATDEPLIPPAPPPPLARSGQSGPDAASIIVRALREIGHPVRMAELSAWVQQQGLQVKFSTLQRSVYTLHSRGRLVTVTQGLISRKDGERTTP